MLNAIIIDDEKKARENLKNLINEYCPEVQISEMADSAEAGLKAIHRHRPDFIFLDIQMPEEDGFDLLRKITHISFDIIFTTAYDKFALDAIKFSALDYLLKPISITELVNAVEKVKTKKQHKTIQQQIETLLHNRQSQDFSEKKITLPTMEGFMIVEIKDILRCESDNAYTIFHLADKKKYLVSRTLKDCESLLEAYDFLRVHQSHLINIKYIKEYLKGKGGTVIMGDGSEIPVSVRNKEAFLQKMPKW